MGLNKVSYVMPKEIVAWTNTGGHGLLATKPIKICTDGLKIFSKIKKDSFISNLKNVEGFKTPAEIVQYFKNLGIDVRLEDFASTHLETFNLIREDIELLRRMGLKESVPKGICLSDWRNIEKTKTLIAEYGLDMRFPAERRAYCGANSNTVFINSSEEANSRSNGVFRKFKHEIGHRLHFTHGNGKGKVSSNGSNSVLGQGIQDNAEFAERQLQVLGIWENLEKSGALQGLPYNVTLSSPLLIRGQKFNALPVQVGDNIVPLLIDSSKAVKYLNEKCNCYNKEEFAEQVAEIFEDLLKGRRFDDLTMLMYDFAGGGRVPNLIVNGRKYDDYIKSLYENKELIEKLREMFQVGRYYYNM